MDTLLLELFVLSLVIDTTFMAPIEPSLFEKLTADDIRYSVNHRGSRKQPLRWNTERIPYELDSVLRDKRVSVIKSAIDAYHNSTCIKFVPKEMMDKDYIRFMDGGYGKCYSYIGRQGGAQDVSIGGGCEYRIGIVIHEIAHALGFYHEHSRPDRDKFVTVRFDRIEKRRRYNFEMTSSPSTDVEGVRYDYLSLMHYGRDYFTVTGQDTIITKDTRYQEKIGQRKYFSVCDLEKVNRFYGCVTFINKNGPCAASSDRPLPGPMDTPEAGDDYYDRIFDVERRTK